MSKLNARQLDALGECARFTDRGIAYFWRRASMARLLYLGLVSETKPSQGLSYFEPTAEGRQALHAKEARR